VTSSDGLTASAAYGIGYLTIRRLVQRFGLQRTLEFWEQTENLPYAIPDQASRAVSHASWTSVNADLAHYIRQTEPRSDDRSGCRPARVGAAVARSRIQRGAGVRAVRRSSCPQPLTHTTCLR
jgi:hypothetical protein